MLGEDSGAQSYRMKNMSRGAGKNDQGKAPGQEDVDINVEEEEGGLLQGARRLSEVSSVGSYELYTPDEDKAVLKSLDRKLVLFMALLYLLSFLDRSSKKLFFD